MQEIYPNSNMIKNWTYKNFTIQEFQQLDSTNSHAFELANLHQISDREIILANSQNCGRGRQNRSWSSPQGNLYFSLVLRPKILAEKIPQISFVGIVALRLAIEKIAMGKMQIQAKWPHDLLIDGKKTAGLLLESKISQKNCEFVILGIGVNIESSPDETIFPAGNLKSFGLDILPEMALKNFLVEFEVSYQNWCDFGFKGVRQSWLKNAYRLQEKITVRFDEKQLEGVFEGLDEEGSLLLKCEGKIVKISAADVL